MCGGVNVRRHLFCTISQISGLTPFRGICVLGLICAGTFFALFPKLVVSPSFAECVVSAVLFIKFSAPAAGSGVAIVPVLVL